MNEWNVSREEFQGYMKRTMERIISKLEAVKNETE